MNIHRTQGCAANINLIGILFDEVSSEHITPLRLKTNCKMKYTGKCSLENCHKYRIGTRGFTRISWDLKGKRM
jgi:hypothetical protein